MNVIHTSCPAVKRGEETFVQWVDVGGENRPVEFTKDIIWLQESESHLAYLHGGKVLLKGAISSDFYGYLTSCDVDSPEQAKAAALYGIERDSTLELVVQTTVFLAPYTETEETIRHNRTKPENRKSQYAAIPESGWRQRVGENGEVTYPCIARKVLGTGVVWSSKNTPEQNAALLAEFRDVWQVPSIMEVAP